MSHSSPVKAIFLGTNSLAVTDSKTTLLIDPYFSRPSRFRLLAGSVAPDSGLVRRILDESGIKKAAAVLITHSHVDHALDAACVAGIAGAVVAGSVSTKNIALGGGLGPERILEAIPLQPYTFGGFTVTFVPGRHLEFPPGLRRLLGIGRAIEKPLVPPARAWAWKEGGTYTLRVEHKSGAFINSGSANFVRAHSGASLADGQAEVLLLGIGGLDTKPKAFVDKWFERVGMANAASRIWLTHWDDFTLPLSAPPRFLGKCADIFLYLKEKSLSLGGPPVELMPWRRWIGFF
jgi:L-ascorbate metabolism protein UlaG (beta-lactamase superfamily)